jgi:1,2-beta-oligoglucan phosphorylase
MTGLRFDPMPSDSAPSRRDSIPIADATRFGLVELGSGSGFRAQFLPPRQSNVYFSSSDADFADRVEAATRWNELRTGRVAVRGGWRLYSSGPGLYVHKVRTCLLGIRESFGDVVFDPVLPRRLDGLIARLRLLNRMIEVRYRVHDGNFGPSRVVVNGVPVALTNRDGNPYRVGGWRVPAGELSALLGCETNVIEIEL